MILLQTVGSLSSDHRAAWRAIRKDLEPIGITAEAYEANHDFIRHWLTHALDTGALDEQATPRSENDETVGNGSSPAFRAPSHVAEGLEIEDPDPNQRADTQTARPASTTTLSIADPRGDGIPRTPGRDGLTDNEVRQTPVSPVAALIATVSRPNSRLLSWARSPIESYKFYRHLKNPVTRRLKDPATIEHAFLAACFHGYSPSILGLLEAGAPLNSTVRKKSKLWRFNPFIPRVVDAVPEGVSALMLAALSGDKITVQNLLRWETCSVAAVNYEANYSLTSLSHRLGTAKFPMMSTALGWALKGGNLDIFRMILDAGADVRQSIHGRTALHEAHWGFIAEELLRRGADIESTCSFSGTVLMTALRARRYDIVYLLVGK
ncbi:MAG: hypothetical protein Q9224_007137, partial [Gallowayella concinna]